MRDIFPIGFPYIIIGFLFGALFTLIIIRYGNTIANKAITAINVCEQSLPRDQHCKLVGVVEDD